MTTFEKKMLQKCLDNDPDITGITLSSWEVEFIESLNAQQDNTISQKQFERLEEIYLKVT